jgi:hypothetical protein
MNQDHCKYLTDECMRLTYGECRTRGCLVRGGYKNGPVDSNKATCISYEIYNELLLKDDLIKQL